MTQKNPDAPSWLGETARRRWNEIWLVVDRTRVKPEIHADSVAAYCAAFGDFAAASEDINSVGLLVKSGDRTIANPSVAIRVRAGKIMERRSWELGLSPGSGAINWPAKTVT